MTQNNDIKDIVGTVSHMKKRGTLKILLIALAVGIALFFIGSTVIGDDKENEKQNDEVTELIGFFDYKELMEKEIEGLCSSVSGVKSVKAVVFFSEVGGSLYAQNTQSGSTGNDKTEYVIIGSGTNAHALYLGESLPTLSGIGVACDTGGTEDTRNELLCLLSATYGLPMTRIYVSELE